MAQTLQSRQPKFEDNDKKHVIVPNGPVLDSTSKCHITIEGRLRATDRIYTLSRCYKVENTFDACSKTGLLSIIMTIYVRPIGFLACFNKHENLSLYVNDIGQTDYLAGDCLLVTFTNWHS